MRQTPPDWHQAARTMSWCDDPSATGCLYRRILSNRHAQNDAAVVTCGLILVHVLRHGIHLLFSHQWFLFGQDQNAADIALLRFKQKLGGLSLGMNSPARNACALV